MDILIAFILVIPVLLLTIGLPIMLIVFALWFIFG